MDISVSSAPAMPQKQPNCGFQVKIFSLCPRTVGPLTYSPDLNPMDYSCLTSQEFRASVHAFEDRKGENPARNVP